MKTPNSGTARHKAGGIDRLIHEPARFGILSILFVVESADYIYLMTQTGLTWGNLSSHLSKLENAGYITVKKDFIGKKPRSVASLTDHGRQAFLEYREAMKAILEHLPKSAQNSGDH